MPELTVKVEVAWASNPLSDPATQTWTDISDHVLEVAGASGRSSEQGHVPAGNCSVKLLDIDGDFDPAHSGGAYWPNVVQGKLIRVRFSDYEDRVLADVPAAYWRLDEPSGTTMVDSSGNGRNGSYINTPTHGQVGAVVLEPASTSVLFTRASFEYGNVPFSAGLNQATVATSVWIYRTSSATYRYIVAAETGNRGFRLFLNPSHAVEFWVGNGAAMNAVVGPTIPVSTWTHVVAVSTASAQTLYVNGALAATGSHAYTPNLSAPTEVGAHGGGNTWDGRLDEVAVFDRRITATGARHHYEMGLGLSTLFTGSVDDWQQGYSHGLGPAIVNVSATDVTETLEMAPSPLDHERLVRRLKPARYFRFGEVAAGKLLDEGTSPQKAVARTSTELETDQALTNAITLNSGAGGWPIEIPGTNVGTGDFTLSCWARSDTQHYGAYLYLASRDSGVHLLLQHWLDAVTGGTSSRSVTARVVRYPASRDWIHYAVVRSSSGGTETIRLYVNGGEVGTASGATINVSATSTVLGSIAGSAMHVAHWALWTSALTAAQVDMLWQSGLPGWQAQTPEARIQTALDLAGWTAPTVLDSGSSRCAASRGGSARGVCAEAAEADEGLFLIDGRGRPTFHSRASRRRLGTQPDYTFGDSAVSWASESPYGDVAINNDNAKLWTSASINNRYAEDASAAASYGRRAAPGDSTRSVLTGRDAQARSEGIVAAHKDPATRIERIEWDLPQTKGGALALQLDVNDWVRVIRRPRTGQTITEDLFVERRQWQIDIANGPGNAGAGKVVCALSATEPGQNSMLTFGTSTYAGTDTLAS